MSLDAGLPETGGYVLAGGASSRMGTNKALLELGGKPLVEHAVIKLRRLCDEVNILGSDNALEAYAPLVRDVHTGCGPLGGLEAALLHSRFDWNLILAVDVPFLSTRFLGEWMGAVLGRRRAMGGLFSFGRPEPVEEIRLSMLTNCGRPQPTLLLLHREVAPFLTEALERGYFKVLGVLESAAEEMAAKRRLKPEQVFLRMEVEDLYGRRWKGSAAPWWTLTKAQQMNPVGMFKNLNTPEDFAEAEQHADALDT